MADHLRSDPVVLQHIIQYMAGLDGKYFCSCALKRSVETSEWFLLVFESANRKKSNKNTWIIDISVKKSHGIRAYLALLFPTKLVPGVYIATYS